MFNLKWEKVLHVFLLIEPAKAELTSAVLSEQDTLDFLVFVMQLC